VQIISDHKSEKVPKIGARLTKLSPRQLAKLLVTVFLGTIKLKLIYKEYLSATAKNYNLIFVARNSCNIMVKSVLFLNGSKYTVC